MVTQPTGIENILFPLEHYLNAPRASHLQGDLAFPDFLHKTRVRIPAKEELQTTL